MNEIIYHSPIYMFRYMIEVFAKDIPKKILDCGAGGERPPLGLFYAHGFETFGIDISSSQLSLAQQFAKQHQMELNLQESNLYRLLHLVPRVVFPLMS